jgi:diguanylate cyclase (GGDEF)-like protein
MCFNGFKLRARPASGYSGNSTVFLMAQTGEPNPPRWSAEESFLELLTDTLESMDRGSRGQFLQRFFRAMAQVEVTEAQSVELWDQAQTRKRDLSESIGKRVALQAALVDVLSSTGQLRLPVLMEYEDLRKLQINAATDPLTGLYNRRFFDDYFEKELNRSIRYSHKLALVVFDLHRFKEVNDRFGHPQGDALLQMAAVTLRKSLRTSDYAFRIGGDEFAILLPQSDTEQAATLSRRLRAAYATSIEPLNLGVPLALDYGLAVYPEDGELQEVLIRVADERLYQLKNGMRVADRAPAPPPPPRIAAPEPRPSVSEVKPAAPEPKPVIPEPKPRVAPPVPAPVVPTSVVPVAPPTPPAAPVTPPAGAVTPPAPPAAAAPEKILEVKKAASEKRRWERVSLASTHAYALIGEGVELTARVLDLGYGGVALETSRPDDFGEAFHAVLHVPILPPVRVSLRRIYKLQGTSGQARIGCSFVT